jgi:hypothetical protein
MGKRPDPLAGSAEWSEPNMSSLQTKIDGNSARESAPGQTHFPVPRRLTGTLHLPPRDDEPLPTKLPPREPERKVHEDEDADPVGPQPVAASSHC